MNHGNHVNAINLNTQIYTCFELLFIKHPAQMCAVPLCQLGMLNLNTSVTGVVERKAKCLMALTLDRNLKGHPIT